MEIVNSFISIINQQKVLIWMNADGTVLNSNLADHTKKEIEDYVREASLHASHILPDYIFTWLDTALRQGISKPIKKIFQDKELGSSDLIEIYIQPMAEHQYSLELQQISALEGPEFPLADPISKSDLLLELAGIFNIVDSIHDSVNLHKALTLLSCFAAADRVYIVGPGLGSQSFKVHYLCYKGEILQQDSEFNPLVLLDYPELESLLRQGQDIHISERSSLKITDDLHKVFIQNQIESLLLLPLMQDQILIGYVGIDSRSYKTNWDSDNHKIFAYFAHNVGHLIRQSSLHLPISKSEERYRILAENMQDLVSWHDENFKFLYVSPSFETVLGYPSDKLLNQPPRNIVHPDDVDTLRNMVRPEIDLYGSAYSEFRLLKSTGEYIWVESITTRVDDAAGNLIHYQTVSRDRTLQKETELALREAEEKYRSIFNSIQDIYYETDQQGIITDISPSIYKHSGYTVNEIVGQPSFFFYEEGSQLEQLVQALKTRKEVIDFEVQLRTKDKRVIFVSLNAQLIFNENGEITGTSGSMRDITDRKLSKQALEKSEARLKQTNITAKVGSWELDPKTMLVSWSDELRKLAGLSGPNVPFTIEQQLNLIFEEDRPVALAAINKLTSTKEQTVAEFRVHLPDGRNRYIKILANPVFSEDQKLSHILGTAMDISEIRTAEKALQKERDLFLAGPVVSMVWHNRQGWPFEFVSKNAITLTGYSAEELLNDIVLYDNLIHPDDLQNVLDETDAYIAQGKKFWQQTYRIIRKDKKVRWITDYVIVQSFRDGVILKTRGYLLDQTEKILTEQKLAESSNLLKKVTDHIPGFIFQFLMFPDGSSCFPYASEGIKNIYELSPESVSKSAAIAFERKHPDDLEELNESIQKSGRELKTWYHEYRVILPEKGMRWLRGNAAPELLEDGSVLWHGFIMDITDRKAEEEEIVLLNKRLTQRNKELEQ